MIRTPRLLALIAAIWTAVSGPALAASPFADWSAVVVAGDWHGARGGPTEAFDNARRDVAAALRKAGFRAENLKQFSVRPERYADTAPAKSELQGIYDTIGSLSAKATSGCLFYLTTHGARQGAVIDDKLLPPGALAGMLDQACGARPTVVVISACFSGIFVPQLAQPNRMILTAARPDRTSFGCGEGDTYPYFDDCFLQSVKVVKTLGALPPAITACVERMERETGMSPPSRPQVSVGSALRPTLMLYAFPKGS